MVLCVGTSEGVGHAQSGVGDLPGGVVQIGEGGHVGSWPSTSVGVHGSEMTMDLHLSGEDMV